MNYEPREDSYLLRKQVKKYSKNKSFLDMGAGSGIQSEEAIRSHAKKILAVDINEESIKILKSKKIPSLKSDLFKRVKGKFNLIAFNPPYLPKDKREDKESRLITTGGEKGDEIIIKFLEQVKKHLTKDGKILIVLSSLTPKKRILSKLKSKKFKKKIISKEKLFMEKLEVWEISFFNNDNA
jgi:release factor glutamine methyltransferase